MIIKTVEEAFKEFREEYGSRRLLVYEDYMVYKTAPGYSDKAAINANELIEDMDLPLVAIPTTSHRKDSFYIQSIYSEI